MVLTEPKGACGQLPMRVHAAMPPAGQEATIVAPAEAAQSTKTTSDLLRRWKEYATSFRVTALPPGTPLHYSITM